MSEAPWVAVVDDGELEDIRELLDDLGVDFTHWHKADVPTTGREPGRLLVTTATHASTLRLKRLPMRKPGRPVWIAILDTDSRTQRNLLLQCGFDFLVRRPVHPIAMRMLLQRAIYGGEENRRGPRVAVGYGITYRAGIRKRKATLIDLSASGCRMLARQHLPRGSKLTVHFPGEMTGGRPFSLSAEVQRARRAEPEGGEGDETSLALRFDRSGKSDAARLRATLARLSAGPLPLPDAEAAALLKRSARAKAEEDDRTEPLVTAPIVVSPDAEGEPGTPPRDRRRQPRAVYEERVLVFGDSERVLVGRDLSPEGMRVEPHPALAVGDRFSLAIEAGPHIEAIVVKAQVIRDDGERGLALHFEWIESGGEERLAQVVSMLPAIESLGHAPDDGAEASGEGVVLSRLLPGLVRLPKRG